MKRLVYRLAAVGLTLVLVLLAGVFSNLPVNAQTKNRISNTQSSPKGLSAGEGQERLLLDKDWTKDNTELRQFQELRKSGAVANAGEVLDHAAQWYAYRLTHTEYQEPKPSSPGMRILVQQAVDQIIDLREPRKPATRAQQEYMKEFGKRFAARLHEVVKNPKIIARVNAAILLARLAKAGQEDVVDILAEVIQDPKEGDAVKLYALRGLKDFFALGRGDSAFSNKEREARTIAALQDYVLHRPPLKEALPEELAAVSYVRVEAIEALGQSLYPAGTKILAKTTQLERPTALVLLRVLRKNGIQPEPSLREQVAAAAALCQLHSKEVDQYNPDYVAYHLGRFLVEFVSQYNGRGEQEKKEPWKIYAHHLSNGLEVMNGDLATPPASPQSGYFAELTKRASRLLDPIQKGNKDNTPSPNDLSTWLDQNPPKSQSVYKGMPEAVVNEGDKTAGG
jgi:hypothetical protein